MEHKKNNMTIYIKTSIYTLIVLFMTYINGYHVECNDDPTIELFVSTGNHQCLFVNRILTSCLGFFYDRFESIQWWAWVSLFFSILATYVLFFIANRIRQEWEGSWLKKAIVDFVLIIILYSTFFKLVTWTRNAFLLSFAGVALSVFYWLEKDNLSKSKYYLIQVLAFFLIIMGGLIRAHCAVLVLPFFFIAIIFELKKINHKLIVYIILITIAAFFSYITLYISFDDEHKEYVEYNNLRSVFCDNKQLFPEYSEIEKEMEKIGIPQFAYDNFPLYTVDTDIWNTDSLRYLLKFRGRNITIGEVLKEDIDFFKQDTNYLWPLLLLICQIWIIVVYGDKKKVIQFALIDIIVFVLCFYLVYLGHPVLRVVQSILFMAVYSSLYFVNIKTNNIHKINEKVLLLLNIVLFVITMAFFGGQLKQAKDVDLLNTYYEPNKRELMNMINADNKHIYILSFDNLITNETEAFGYWERVPEDYCSNLFYTSGWGAMAPVNLEKLSSYGISNPLKAIFERDDVISSYSTRLEEYITTIYDSSVRASIIMGPYNARFARYVSSAEYQGAHKIGDGRIIVEGWEYHWQDDLFYACTKVDGIDKEKIKDIYCVVDDDGQLVRYVAGNFDENDNIFWIMHGIGSWENNLKEIYVEYEDGSTEGLEVKLP